MITRALLILMTLSMLWLPSKAQDSKPAKPPQFDLNASQNGLYVDPNWANSDAEDKMLSGHLNPLIPGYAKQAPAKDQLQQTAVTKMRISDEVSHGEIPVGVLGAYTEDYDGTITKILPGSDLIRLGIVVGDKVKRIDGKTFANVDDFRNACRGQPGSTMILIIESKGKTAPYIVKRTDARLYATDDQDGYYKWCVNQMKRW